jgi:hypothetical protein
VRRPLLALVLAWLLMPGLVEAAPPEQAAGCRFVLGFAQLRSLVGAPVMGDCLEDEHFNPANGDTLQHTTGGLLVWRKADNFTAFTDGYRSWVNGPYGVQVRLNSQRFPWERDPLGPAAPAASGGCSSEQARVAFDAAPTADGALQVSGTVTNGCPVAVDLTLDVLERAGPEPNSRPVAEAPTVAIAGLPPGQARDFAVRVPGPAGGRIEVTAVPVPTSARGVACVDLGGSRCTPVHERALSAVEALRRLPEGAELLRGTADAVRVTLAPLPPNVLGFYSTRSHTIGISSQLDGTTRAVRATVLAHELRHALDHVQGRLPTSQAATEEDCYRSERDAFVVTARVWSALWQGRLPAEGNPLYAQINAITRDAADPAALDRWVRDRYHHVCSDEAA